MEHGIKERHRRLDRMRYPGWSLALALVSGTFGPAVGAQNGQKSGATNAPADQPPSIQTGPSTSLPTFDVVSIKPHKDEGMMMRNGVRYGPDGFVADGFPLQMFILQAFGLSADRILNEPDWARSARFDVEAKVAP